MSPATNSDFTLISDVASYETSEIIELNTPLSLELISPGGTLKDLSTSYIYIRTFLKK